jgi:DNA invertase Pin-like site-specific DNA recombinase
MLVGYMRVSTDNDRQVLDLQRDALVAAGVDERHLLRIGSAAAVEIEQVWQRRSLLRQATAWWSENWTGWGGHCRIS